MVTSTLPIGDFSRATHLSAKTLRHYHEAGLLEPARIDPSSGYRHYRPDQIATAQIIRRLRDLEMPVERDMGVLDTTDLGVREPLNRDRVAHPTHTIAASENKTEGRRRDSRPTHPTASRDRHDRAPSVPRRDQ